MTPGDFTGRYIHYGIREHGMAAAMNGISLHGGYAPAGGDFPGFHRLCATLDADRGTLGTSRWSM